LQFPISSLTKNKERETQPHNTQERKKLKESKIERNTQAASSAYGSSSFQSILLLVVHVAKLIWFIFFKLPDGYQYQPQFGDRDAASQLRSNFHLASNISQLTTYPKESSG
jgi:hypothetical protein